MVHTRKQKLEKDEVKVKEMIKRLDKKGKPIDEIDEVLVYGMGFSPEYSWKLIKTSLGIKEMK